MSTFRCENIVNVLGYTINAVVMIMVTTVVFYILKGIVLIIVYRQQIHDGLVRILEDEVGPNFGSKSPT